MVILDIAVCISNHRHFNYKQVHFCIEALVVDINKYTRLILLLFTVDWVQASDMFEINEICFSMLISILNY